MDSDALKIEIRRLLTEEKRAVPLSNKLFGPNGLFQQLASTAQQRRELVETPLFQEAQKRISELERHDAAEFGALVKDYLDQTELKNATVRVEEAPTT